MGMRFHMTVEEAGKQDFLRLSEELEIHRKVTNQLFSVISHIQVPDLDHQRRMRESWQQRVNNSVFQIINNLFAVLTISIGIFPLLININYLTYHHLSIWQKERCFV